MATIVTRAAKGSPLTHNEVDANFTNLNTDKVESSALATVATSGAYADLTGTPTAYTDAAVDTHLNTGTATTGEVLSWTGTDYDWIAAGGGGGIAAVVDDTTPQLGGDLDVNSKAINFGDSDGTTTNILTFGVGNDLKIYHHATAGTYITENGTGNLNLMAGDLRLMNGAGSTTLRSLSNGIQISNSYTLPTTDGTVGQVMTTDGSGAVTFADAGGGGSALELYAENPVTFTAPSATGANAIAIGNSALASDANSLAGPLSRAAGSHSVALGIANNSASYGAGGSYSISMGYQSRAMASQSLALGQGAYVDSDSLKGLALGSGPYVQQCDYGIAIGKNARVYGGNTATEATAIGSSYASGTASFAAAIGNITSSYGATGANSIAIGQLAKATAAGSVAIGNTATSTAANLIALGGTTDTVQISGTYTLPTTDGTVGQVMTTDGSGAVTFADAGGGGSALELYAENPVTPTAPSATGINAVAIGSGATATGNQSFAFGHGADATAYRALAVGGDNICNVDYASAFGFGANASGNSATSLGRGSSASGESSVALGYRANATAQFAVGIGYDSDARSTGSLAAGFNAQTATGSNATALTNSYASGNDSFAAAIANNTATYGATGANSVAMGDRAKASGSRSFSLGRFGQATNTRSINIGDSAISSADSSVAIGYTAEASEAYSVALGYKSSSVIQGKYAYAGGAFTSAGDSQSGVLVLRSDTTDATAEALTTNNNAASITNQVILPNSSAYSFSGTIVARQKASDGTASAAWEIKGLIRREANAASTVLVNSALTVLDNTPAWGLALTADTTNGGLKIEATGAAATNIRWVATINTSEVTYA